MKTTVTIFGFALSLAAISCSSSSAPPATAAKTPAPAVRITMFYATAAHPAADEKESLCYGVENADSVRLEPAVDRVWPTMSRCFDIPTRPATYTLTAFHGAEKVSQTVTVAPAAPVPSKAKLFQISSNPQQATAGEKVAVCYNAMDAVKVTIEPGEWFGPHGPSMGCIRDTPAATTTYVITATGAGGDRDVQKITVKVTPKP
jgi:hypothetical protein